jgi:hypothetical protein
MEDVTPVSGGRVQNPRGIASSNPVPPLVLSEGLIPERQFLSAWLELAAGGPGH